MKIIEGKWLSVGLPICVDNVTLLLYEIANIFLVSWSMKEHEVHHQPVRYRHCKVRTRMPDGRRGSSFHLDFAAKDDQSVGSIRFKSFKD